MVEMLTMLGDRTDCILTLTEGCNQLRVDLPAALGITDSNGVACGLRLGLQTIENNEHRKLVPALPCGEFAARRMGISWLSIVAPELSTHLLQPAVAAMLRACQLCIMPTC